MTIQIIKMLDSTDRKLLEALREDARSSTSALARRLGLARATVQSRLRRLEKGGVIRGYTVALGDNYRQGLIAAHVLVKVEQRLTARVCRHLEAMPEISALYAISGDYDLIVMVEAEGTAALSRLLDAIGGLAGVERTHSSVILETKFQR